MLPSYILILSLNVVVIKNRFVPKLELCVKSTLQRYNSAHILKKEQKVKQTRINLSGFKTKFVKVLLIKFPVTHLSKLRKAETFFKKNKCEIC